MRGFKWLVTTSADCWCRGPVPRSESNGVTTRRRCVLPPWEGGDVTITNEALALFVRFWLTATPALPDTAQAAARSKGRERYEAYIEALVRRLAKGHSLAKELAQDVDPQAASKDGDEK